MTLSKGLPNSEASKAEKQERIEPERAIDSSKLRRRAVEANENEAKPEGKKGKAKKIGKGKPAKNSAWIYQT